jgi:hypothetical protein
MKKRSLGRLIAIDVEGHRYPLTNGKHVIQMGRSRGRPTTDRLIAPTPVQDSLTHVIQVETTKEVMAEVQIFDDAFELPPFNMGNENGEAHSFDLFGTPSYDPLGNQP